MKHVVIIGNGVSGITAARHIRKRSDDRITVISAETDHFFSRTALMYIYMGHMTYENTKPYEDWFWEKNRIELKRAFVKEVDSDQQQLNFADGSHMSYDTLILACGSKPNKFGWPGQDLEGVQGMYSFQDLESMEKNTKDISRAVIVGGGLIGVEMAEMLLTRNIPVTFLVRENRFWGNVLPKEEGELVARHMVEHHIDLRLQEELDEVIDDGTGRVKGIRTKKGEIIDCQFVGLTAGVSPNIAFLKDSKIETGRGIKVNRYLETNIPNVYAIGDCAESTDPVPGRRPLEQVWYTGRMMGETVARTITGNRSKYEPGHWFNSAKFFDIEYQTYGWVRSNLDEGNKDFYWEDETGKICVKIVYDASSHQFIGINVFGMRMRHEVFDRWLNEKASVEHVMEHLKDANFDPEFYKQYEEVIVQKFNQDVGTNISVKKRSLRRIFNL